MAIGHKIGKFLVIGAGSFLFSIGGFAADNAIHFASPMGTEKWRMSGNPVRCGLAVTIPNFGIGYFEQFATKPPHFILRKWDEVPKSLPATVSVRSPVWKPNGHDKMVAITAIKPGGFGIYLQRDLALKLLTYLSEGYQANFSYLSDEGFNVSVALSPIRFQKSYAKYQECLGGLLAYDYKRVKESVFHFDVDSKSLTELDKIQLRKVAQYAAADTEIEKIQILGYADESGRKGYNNAVSQYRAEAVKKYLLKIGVPTNKLAITWFGAKKPIARNDTDEGRAENRRVVVNLIRK